MTSEQTNQYEFSVGLKSTISSLLKDDEDFQIVHAQQLLTYLSNKGFYPPSSIIKNITDMFKSRRLNDEAVAFQIMKILNSFKSNNYLIGLEKLEWDLLMNSLRSLRYHLSGEKLEGDMYQFLISRLLVSYFISNHSGIVEFIDSKKNRIIDEIMNLLQYCDLETFKELLNFLLIIYKTGQNPRSNTLPYFCIGFKLISQFNRRVLFCQLLEPGKIKNEIVSAFIEDIFKNSNKDASVESLSTWFIKLFKMNFKKKKSTNSQDANDPLNDSVESTKSLYSMDLDKQEPIGIHELFILLCSQLYQSSIITAIEDSPRLVQWDNVYNGYKEFSNLIFNFIQDSPNSVSNPDLIKAVLNDLDIIIQYKTK